ncbi:hypothetical protein APU20_06355 [Klebsiella variicola]|nr:hypothetical protein APU20_06355 [Klebsiella variicola]PLE57696.1 hypothetical protein B6I74_24510 [Klebsiella variicola]PXK71738.1 hypothetical protein DMS07_24175 [Klebsiella variicola]
MQTPILASKFGSASLFGTFRCGQVSWWGRSKNKKPAGRRVVALVDHRGGVGAQQIGGNIRLSGLINKVSEQAIARQVDLPQGMVQEVVIDVRGQILTDEIRRKILKDISSKSNGIIKASNIRFIEK